MGLFGIFRGKSNAQRQDNSYGLHELQQQMANADKEIEALGIADQQFKEDGNLGARIRAYEKVLHKRTDWNSFNQCLSLAEMYIKAGNNNAAWAYLNQMLIWFSDPKGPGSDESRIRRLQFKILKSEGKNADAFIMLVFAYVATAYTPTHTIVFNKDKFLKEVKTTAKALTIPERDLALFADDLETALGKKHISEKEAKEISTRFLKKYK